MKTKLSLLGAASLASVTGVHAQSATTNPVGYITINVAGAATAVYSGIAPTLVNKTEFSGIVSSAAGTTLTVSGGLTPAAFATGFWVEITNGANEGAWTNVTGNTANTITTSADISAMITGGTTTVAVRKHVTISDFFGPTNSAGLEPGADAGLATNVFLFEGGVPATQVFYDGSGWFDGNFAPAADLAIKPGQGCLVLRKAGTAPLSFVQVGHVKTGISQFAVSTAKSVIGVRSAVGTTLANSGLRPAPVADPNTGLLVGADAGLADNLFTFSPAGVPTGYFHDGTDWFDFNFTPAGPTPLPEGLGIYCVRRHPTGFNYKAPAVVIAP